MKYDNKETLSENYNKVIVWDYYNLSKNQMSKHKDYKYNNNFILK